MSGRLIGVVVWTGLTVIHIIKILTFNEDPKNTDITMNSLIIVINVIVININLLKLLQKMSYDFGAKIH